MSSKSKKPRQYKIVSCSFCGKSTKVKRISKQPRCSKCGKARQYEQIGAYMKRRAELSAANGTCRLCEEPTEGHSKLCLFHWCYNIVARNLKLKGDECKDMAELLLNKLREQSFACYYTGLPLTLGLNASIEHVIPRSKDRSLETEPSNLVWIRLEVNRMRSNLPFDDFIKFCKLCVASPTLSELATTHIVHPHRVMV